MAELITLADVQAFRAVAVGDDSLISDVLIPAACRWFEGRIGRQITSATVTERISGDGTSMLMLSRWPVTAVASVNVYGSVLSVMTPTLALDSGEQVFLPSPSDTGPRWLIARNGSIWPEGQGNILVTYTGGWTTPPADMKLALVMVVHLLFKEQSRIGEGSLNIGQESIQQVVRNADDYQFIEDTVRRYGW